MPSYHKHTLAHDFLVTYYSRFGLVKVPSGLYLNFMNILKGFMLLDQDGAIIDSGPN